MLYHGFVKLICQVEVCERVCEHLTLVRRKLHLSKLISARYRKLELFHLFILVCKISPVLNVVVIDVIWWQRISRYQAKGYGIRPTIIRVQNQAWSSNLLTLRATSRRV